VGKWAFQEGLAIALLPKWLDVKQIPIENGSGDEEIPMAGKNRRSSGIYRIEIFIGV
jgi:hypothetical protein